MIDVAFATCEARPALFADDVPARPLYARVDGIVRGDVFMLMELEVLEPRLYLPLRPAAAERFADALVTRLRARTNECDAPNAPEAR